MPPKTASYTANALWRTLRIATLGVVIVVACMQTFSSVRIATRMTESGYDETKTPAPTPIPSSISAKTNVTRKIAYVHVGRAGGSTINLALCHKRQCRGFAKKKSYYSKNFQNDSALARQTYLEMHMGTKPDPAELVQDNFTTWLWTLRNPITRAISAYKYLHPDSGLSVNAHEGYGKKRFFYRLCFPTWEWLAQALDVELPPRPKQLGSCQSAALSILQGADKVLRHVNMHMQKNYHYYYTHSVKKLPNLEVLVVRTEHLWDDMNRLEVIVGGSPHHVFQGQGEVANENVNNTQTTTSSRVARHVGNSAVKSSPDDRKLGMTRLTRRNMCCFLCPEMEAYQDVLDRAANLNHEEKVATMQEVYNLCDISTEESSSKDSSRSLTFSWKKWNQANCPQWGILRVQKVWGG